MELAIVFIFIGAVALWGLRPGFSSRNGTENAYYIFSLTICLAVLALNALDMWPFDIMGSMITLFHRHGLGR